MEKNELIGYDNTIVGVDSKGRNTLKVYLRGDHLEAFKRELAKAEAEGRGVKLSFHTGDKVAQQSGRKFKSTFGFVSAIQESQFGGANAGGGAPRVAVPKAAGLENVNKNVVG